VPNKQTLIFRWVVGIHVAVIGGLLIAPLFHRRPKEIVTFVELVSEPAPIEQPVEVPVPMEEPVIEEVVIEEVVVDLPAPTNRVEKVKTPEKVKPPKKVKTPEKVKAPEKPKWKAAKVIPQNKRVTKTSKKPAPVTPSKKRISASDIRTALNTGGGGTVDPHGAYYSSVRERMYGAWQVPVGVAYGLSAQASITIGADGSISNRRLIRPSGNAAFDQSVQSALNTVNRLPRPPADLPSRTITIEFQPQ